MCVGRGQVRSGAIRDDIKGRGHVASPEPIVYGKNGWEQTTRGLASSGHLQHSEVSNRQSLERCLCFEQLSFS
jgi:hypothetical protein